MCSPPLEYVKIKMIMKEKKVYYAPKMERVGLEVEAPIAASFGGGGGIPVPTPNFNPGGFDG